MIKYRIRVGKTHFQDPHYVTRFGRTPHFASIFINSSPCSWKKREVALKKLEEAKEYFRTAELEEFEAPDC